MVSFFYVVVRVERVRGIVLVAKTSWAAFEAHYGGRQLQGHDNPTTSKEGY